MFIGYVADSREIGAPQDATSAKEGVGLWIWVPNAMKRTFCHREYELLEKNDELTKIIVVSMLVRVFRIQNQQSKAHFLTTEERGSAMRFVRAIRSFQTPTYLSFHSIVICLIEKGHGNRCLGQEAGNDDLNTQTGQLELLFGVLELQAVAARL
jgi:hypothetical protein